MTWFLVALVAPTLYALSNHVDKVLLSKYVEAHSIPALIIVSSLVGTLFLPFLLLFQPPVFSLEIEGILAMLAAGVLGIAGLFPYFYALDGDDTSLVVPIFQTVPVFSYLFGVAFLGEVLSGEEFTGAALIIAGSFVISIDFDAPVFQVKFKMLGLMLLSSLLFSISAVLFKFVVVDSSLTVTLFWEYLGALFVGVGLLFRKSYRVEAVRLVRHRSVGVVGLNAGNELLALIANVCQRFAQVLVPVALAQSVLGFQPVFVLLFGVLFARYFPEVLKEDFSGRVLAQKVVCIALIFAGAILIV